jgi:hypothetical protein
MTHVHQCASLTRFVTCRDDKAPNDEGTPWGEQEQLEQDMLKRAGANAKAVEAHPDAPPQYEFVEDDHIDFVVMETIKGDLDDDGSSRRAGAYSLFVFCVAMMWHPQEIRVKKIKQGLWLQP